MSVKTNNSLSEIFDVNPITGETVVPQVVAKVDESKPDTKLDNDFELARTTIQNAILKASHSLEVASLVAAGTEDSKSFDAVGNLVSKLVDASEKLVGIHEKKAKAEPKKIAGGIIDQTGENTTNINGPVFVGSTSELAKFLSDRNK